MFKKVCLPAIVVLGTAFILLNPGTAMAQSQDSNQGQDVQQRIFHYPLKEKPSKAEKRALEEEKDRANTVVVPGTAPWPTNFTDNGPVYYGYYDRFGDWHSEGYFDMAGAWHEDEKVVPLTGSGSSWF